MRPDLSEGSEFAGRPVRRSSSVAAAGRVRSHGTRRRPRGARNGGRSSSTGGRRRPPPCIDVPQGLVAPDELLACDPAEAVLKGVPDLDIPLQRQPGRRGGEVRADVPPGLLALRPRAATRGRGAWPAGEEPVDGTPPRRRPCRGLRSPARVCSGRGTCLPRPAGDGPASRRCSAYRVASRSSAATTDEDRSMPLGKELGPLVGPAVERGVAGHGAADGRRGLEERDGGRDNWLNRGAARVVDADELRLADPPVPGEGKRGLRAEDGGVVGGDERPVGSWCRAATLPRLTPPSCGAGSATSSSRLGSSRRLAELPAHRAHAAEVDRHLGSEASAHPSHTRSGTSDGRQGQLTVLNLPAPRRRYLCVMHT